MKRVTIMIIICSVILTACGLNGDDNSALSSSIFTNESSLTSESSIDVSEEPSEEPSAPEQSAEEPSEEPSAPEASVEETSKEMSETPLLQKEDVIPVGDSQTEFVSDKYPGKRLVRETINRDPYLYPYPFFVIDEELYHVDWDGYKALVFSGRHLNRLSNTPADERSVLAVYYRDTVRSFSCAHKVEELGKLIVFFHLDRSRNGTVYFMDTRPDTGVVMCAYEYDDLFENVNSDYVICYNMIYAGFVVPWRVIDLEGNPHSLPVPDECRWSVEEIAFDTESDDPDAVIVKYRENGELKTVKANLKDTRIVSVNDYYDAVNPDFEWDD